MKQPMRFTLPNNWFGITVMLVLFVLFATVFFTVPYWLLSLVAPWWVAIPFSILVCLLGMLSIVRKREDKKGG
jgi:hypothetical protein